MRTHCCTALLAAAALVLCLAANSAHARRLLAEPVRAAGSSDHPSTRERIEGQTESETELGYASALAEMQKPDPADDDDMAAEPNFGGGRRLRGLVDGGEEEEEDNDVAARAPAWAAGVQVSSLYGAVSRGQPLLEEEVGAEGAEVAATAERQQLGAAEMAKFALDRAAEDGVGPMRREEAAPGGGGGGLLAAGDSMDEEWAAAMQRLQADEAKVEAREEPEATLW